MSHPPAGSIRRDEQSLLQLHRAAVELCLERGLDGFTMDDLAASLGISRRTLFNRVGDKLSAVLGTDGGLDDHLARTFPTSTPTGTVFTDLATTILAWVDARGVSAEELEFGRLVEAAIRAEPRLAVEAARRTQRSAAAMAHLVSSRQGWEDDDLRARVLTRVMGAISQETVELARTPAHHGKSQPLRSAADEVLAAFRAVIQSAPTDS